MADRSSIVNGTLRLERLTILWNAVEAVVAVGAGRLAGSIALVGFGLDSVIETVAANFGYEIVERGSDEWVYPATVIHHESA